MAGATFLITRLSEGLTVQSEKASKRFSRRIRESWPWWILLLPAFIYVCLFDYGPMYGLLIAFKNYRPSMGIIGSPWIGISHFARFISQPNFWKMIRNTLAITFYSLATFPCAIIFALMLNEVRQIKLKKTMQMITYAPHFMSEVVVCSLVLMMLDRANGPINNIVAFLGGSRIPYITVPEYFPSIYVWSGVWQNLGWSSILYISALSSVSLELVEAAKIDGASRLQIISHVNIPCILPTIAITFIMRTGGLLSVGYSKIFLLQNDLNLDASQVISTYVYNIGILDGQFSYSSAIGLFNNVANIIVLLVANKIVKKVTETGLF